MSVKDVNILEKHVEKIVLAVAAAGALWLGYLAIQPVTIPGPGGTPIAAGDVEAKAADAVEKMKATEPQNQKPTPDPNSPANRNYAAEYRRIVNDQPIDPKLGALQQAVPQIGPVGMAVTGGTTGEPTQKYTEYASPKPAAPEMVTAEAWQQPVAEAPVPDANGMVQPVAPGTALNVHDQNAVLVQGYIPVGRMQAEMDAVKNQPGKKEYRIRDELRKVSIYRIQVQRRDRGPNGFAGSPWKDVTPGKGHVKPTEIPFTGGIPPEPLQTMAVTEQEFKQIVLPDFHLDATGMPNVAPVLKNPPRKEVTDRLRALQAEISKMTGAAAPAGPGFGAGGFVAPVPAEVMPGEGVGAVPGVSADVSQIRQQPLLPFSFWDDNVEAGKEYQYQVRVAYVNTLFNWIYGLKDEKVKEQPLLYSEWVVVPQPVVVHSDVAFFVTSTSGRNKSGTQKVNFWVFKLTGGKWYRGDFEAFPGGPIAGTIRMVDQQDKPIEVDTGYKVVDFTESSSGSDVHVVLLDGTGKLTTRDSSSDKADPERERLLNLAVKRAAAPKPETQPGLVNPTGMGRGRGPLPTLGE